jgi:uncharacterized Ntn-hydrolase superfamily protein
MRTVLLLLVLVIRALADPEVHTFSIVAFDPKTGDLGIAVESKYFGVGSVVPWAKAGVGAVATQSLARVSFGPDGLQLMQDGTPAEEVLRRLIAKDERSDFRQVGIVDARGRVAAHTGAECIPWAGHRTGENFTVQGNLLTGAEVIAAMAETFERARSSGSGELAEWLMSALEAGQAAGGDRRGQQSAALLVVRADGGPGGDNDRYVDLRVEDHPQPIVELHRLLKLHRRFYQRK